MKKIGEVLKLVEKELNEAGIQESQIESEVILMEELHLSRAELYLNLNKNLSLNLLKEKIAKRSSRFPLAYILGKTQFMGLEFLVDERVMIPRQETEVLVETVLNCEIDRSRINPTATSAINRIATILDLGTGCGNIAISLAKSMYQAKIYATDISSEALALARENANKNGVEENISFLQGDLFEPIRNSGLFKKIDIIVSNPPYIPSQEIKSLQKEIQYEPLLAFDGGFDGLDFYHKIINEAPLYLKNGGYLFLEIGFNQVDEVRNLISKNINFKESGAIKDYNGIERVIWAQTKTDN